MAWYYHLFQGSCSDQSRVDSGWQYQRMAADCFDCSAGWSSHDSSTRFSSSRNKEESRTARLRDGPGRTFQLVFEAGALYLGGRQQPEVQTACTDGLTVCRMGITALEGAAQQCAAGTQLRAHWGANQPLRQQQQQQQQQVDQMVSQCKQSGSAPQQPQNMPAPAWHLLCQMS
jgi:hypothetical protein